MESPLNAYRAFVLSEIYKLGDDFAHVMVSLKNSLTSKQVNALSKRSLQLIDRIENLCRKIVELVLELVERQKQISPDEIVGLV